MTAVESRCIPEFDIDFSERFQIHLENMFPSSCTFLNTRAAKSFYFDLLDFSPQSLIGRKSLLQLLQEHALALAMGPASLLCFLEFLHFSVIGGRNK